jgi:hypothetical protein
VRFTDDQRFPIPAKAAFEFFADPSFATSLTGLTKVSTPELVEDSGPGDVRIVKLRYQFIAPLPAAALAVVDRDRLSWVDETRWDAHALSAHTTLHPDNYGSKLTASLQQSFREADDGCVRSVHGDLKVHMLLVGSQVERAIVSGLREHLTEERTAALKRL